MKFNSLVLITIFLGNFRLCNRINSVQTIFRKHTGYIFTPLRKKYNPGKITVDVLEDK